MLFSYPRKWGIMAKLTISNRYGTTPNDLLNNPEISLKAKGLFGFIQSKPDDWDFSAERIAFQTKDGRDSIQGALRELEDAGYLRRKRYQDNKGFWQVEYILTDIPENGKSYDGKSSVGLPSVGKPLGNSKQEISKKDYSKQEIVTAKAEDVIAKLYYEVIKAFGLPVRNHDNVRSAIAKMKTEDTEENLIKYLTFVRDKWLDLNYDYKPELTEALDIHAKRLAIISSVKRVAEKSSKQTVVVI